jgi:hypothetical protein
MAGTTPALASAKLSMRGFLLIGALASLAAFTSQDAQARGFGGGGFRGGGGFGGFNRGGMSAGQRPIRQTAQSRPATANNGAVGSGSRSTRTADSNTRMAGNGNGNTNNANSGVVGSGNGNTGAINNGNVGNKGVVNTGNVVVGNDVNVNVGNGNSGWAGYNGYPVGAGAAYATGVAVGTTATAAAVGSYYASLPAGCSPYYWGTYNYYTCGGTWYQPRYQSGSTVYVVISDPTKTK